MRLMGEKVIRADEAIAGLVVQCFGNAVDGGIRIVNVLHDVDREGEVE